MKKSVVRSTLGLLALLVMLSSAAWAAGASEDYQADEDVQNTPYAPLDGGAEEDQPWDFAEAWRLAAAEGGVVTLQQDVLAAAEDAPEGIFVQVPEDGQVTLNLNGHRLAGEDVPCLIYVGARGRLTVTDGGQSGGQIVGVVGVDDGSDDPDEWGQVELLGDVEVVDPNVMVLADSEAEYTNGGVSEPGTFVDMWNKAATNGGTVKLLADVTAQNGSFGTGNGFSSGDATSSGSIQVPAGKTITLDLNGNKIDRGLSTNSQRTHGVIYVQSGGTLNLQDGSGDNSGTITGGNSPGYAGAIEVRGTLNMSGGTITGNKTIYGGTNRYGDGGGVYVSGTFKMSGGVITNNEASNNGGGIALASGATFEMTGGTISGNRTSNNGGGVYVTDAKYINNKFVVSGSPVIKDNTGKDGCASNVYLDGYTGATANQVDVQVFTITGELNESAHIGVSVAHAPNPAVYIGYVNDGVSLSNVNVFTSDNDQYGISKLPANPKIIVLHTGAATHTHTLNIGLTGIASGSENVDFSHKITGGTDYIYVDGAQRTSNTLTDGNYYLAEDITISNSIVISGTVNLCLNGHSITMNSSSEGDYQVIRLNSNSTLNLCDCNSTNGHHTITYHGKEITIGGGLITGGRVCQQSSSSNNGGGIYCNTNAKLNLYSGTIAGNCAGASNATSGYGGGVYVSGATFNMYGGTISYNEVDAAPSVQSHPRCGGGGVACAGTFNMQGGEIKNNAASGGSGYGGGIYISNGCSASISGSARITGNQGGYGGGVYVPQNSSLTVGGGAVIYGNYSGTDETSASNVYLAAQSNPIIVSGALTSGAKIGVHANLVPPNRPIVSGSMSFHIDATYTRYFKPDNNSYIFEYSSGSLSLKYDTTHRHTDIAFDKPLPTLSSPLATGKYYLNNTSYTPTDTVTISGTVDLCLNGKPIYSPGGGKPAFRVPSGAVLNLYNCAGAGNFSGLSNSGGVEVAGGGTLKLMAQDGSTVETYAPAAGTSGGKVTVNAGGTVTKPSEGGEDPTPGGTHAERHPELAGATAISAGNFASVTKGEKPNDYNGVLPEVTTAYRYLTPGKYYLDGNFTMPYALIVVPGADGAATDFCLYGSNLGADNDTWLYEMQHVFWVPNQAVLNVLDCQRDLHIVWLYGGRVFLKNGARVNISGKVPDYITTIEMDNGAEGEVKIEYVDQEPVMTLPKGSTLTQKAPGKPDQIITNRDGVLEMTTSGAATKITPPSESASINLKLPETVGEEAPAIVLEAPAGSTVQTVDGPEIKLEQPGEVAADGTVSSPKVTVKTEEAETTATAPSGGNVQVNADGEAQVPEGSTVTTGGETVKIEEIGGGAADAVTVLPSGQIQLPAGGEVTLGSSKRGSATIVIALPGGGAGTGTIDITGTGVTPPKGSTVTVKPKKESVTIVIALPWPAEGGEPPEIRFSDNGALILPEGTEVTTRNGDQETTTTVTEDAPYLDPETGELTETDLEAPPQPSEPVNPNEPTGETEVITPETPINRPDVKVEMDDKGEITVTPADPEKLAVVIKPQPQGPDQPGETPAPPVVDETGKVFIDTPFKVETEDGTDITAEKGGSVDPDGNVTGETVTVEQKKPDGTTESKTTLTAPEGDAVKVGPDGESKAPVGTEVKQDDVTVKIDDVPDPTKPVTVKPDGTVDLPSGSEITVTPNPDQPEQKYTVKIDQVPDPEQPVPVKPGGGVDLPGGSQITITPKPDQPEQKYTVIIPADKGGEVKPDPDGKITLPPGAEVTGPDGKDIIISSSGGAIDPSTGEITGAAPSDVPGGNFPIIDSGGSGSGGSSPASYVIMASASIGGGISPDKRVTVRSGADQTFTIKPDEGYVISDVLVDSESVGAVDSYTFRNVRSGHTIQALFVAEGMSGHGHQGPCPKDETCPIWPYTDSIPTDWYHDGVHYCIENDLMIGTAPVLWEPDIPLSRAMMAQVLYNKAGQPAVGGDGVFSDVDREWYWPAITWGGRSNVLLGYDDGSYGPQNPITREQLATLLWRYAGQPQFDGELSFSDAAQVSDYAKQALNWASRQGVIAGYPDGTFRPQANASRAEAAQMIMRYFEL